MRVLLSQVIPIVCCTTNWRELRIWRLGSAAGCKTRRTPYSFQQADSQPLSRPNRTYKSHDLFHALEDYGVVGVGQRGHGEQIDGIFLRYHASPCIAGKRDSVGNAIDLVGRYPPVIVGLIADGQRPCPIILEVRIHLSAVTQIMGLPGQVRLQARPGTPIFRKATLFMPPPRSA